MKRIAIIANSSWNIYNYRLSLCRFLQSKRYQIILIAPEDRYTTFLKDEFPFSFYPLKNLIPHSKNPFNEIALLKELYNTYKKLELNLVLQYTIKPNIYGSLVAQQLRIPCISTVTGLGYSFMQKDKSTQAVSWLYKIAFKKNKYIVFHNTDDYNLFVQKKLVEKVKAKVIKGSGVDTNYFISKNEIIENGKFIFLFIGRLLYDKGIIEYVQAARQIKQTYKEVEFWIVGDIKAANPSAISKKELDKWISDKIIKYLGKTDHIKEVIQKSSVVVLPSYREGMPRSILEAMAMSKPIITTNSPGCRETVEENINGFKVPPKNANALAKAMEKMIHLKVLGNQLNIMGQASRIKVEKEFSHEIVNQSYLDLITTS